MHNADMFGLNWIDAIIIVLLIGAVIGGLKIGFASQALVISGFFGTLFLVGWLLPHLLPIHDPTLRYIVNANLVLLVALYAAVRCLDVGQKLHWSFRRGQPQVEAILGAVPSLVAGLVLVWLLGSAISRLPFAGFSNSVRDSRISQQLANTLPAVPAVFATFDKTVNPNAQPYVFVQPKPQADFNYTAAEVQAAEAKAAASVVRITSFGCGGLASGSGFVAAPNLVITNAHVIAGVKRPIIKYAGSSYEAVPVLFDPGLDFAVLRTQHLPASALPLADKGIHSNTTVAVLGYPGGNYQATPGIIRENLPLLGRSIYNIGVFGRDAYGVQTAVAQGSSGGPIVLANGQVAGIIFSKPDDTPNYAYGVASSYLVHGLQKAEQATRRVGTGACTAD